VKGWLSRGGLSLIISKSSKSCYSKGLAVIIFLGHVFQSRQLMNTVISLLIRLIEIMFVGGIIGSAVVVLLTSIEDFKMLFERDSSSHAPADQTRG